MSKYRAELLFSDGEIMESDEVFDNYEDAEKDGDYLLETYLENAPAGIETLHLSDPDEYPDEDIDDEMPEIVIREI